MQAKRAGEALLVDLAGDSLAVLGTQFRSVGDGVRSWLAADPTVGTDALRALEVQASPYLCVLPAGPAGLVPPARRRWDDLAAYLADEPRPVVVDLGSTMFGEASGRTSHRRRAGGANPAVPAGRTDR